MANELRLQFLTHTTTPKLPRYVGKVKYMPVPVRGVKPLNGIYALFDRGKVHKDWQKGSTVPIFKG